MNRRDSQASRLFHGCAGIHRRPACSTEEERGEEAGLFHSRVRSPKVKAIADLIRFLAIAQQKYIC